MKKLLLTSAILASSLFAFAQTPAVPNGDFENWFAADCGTETPDGYETLADKFADENDGVCPWASGVSKTVNKYTGTNALSLTSVSDGASTFGNLVAISESFNGRPTKLVGYTYFIKDGTTDELNIFVSITGANDEEIAYGEATISATQTGYTKFEITLEYDELVTASPATLEIGFMLGTSVSEQLTSSANTSTLIDALTFEYATATATVNYSATSPINVFAANKNINFSENVSDVHVVDMVGASKMQETAATKTLNAGSLTAGMYIVTYKYNDAYFSKKVIIE